MKHTITFSNVVITAEDGLNPDSTIDTNIPQAYIQFKSKTSSATSSMRIRYYVKSFTPDYKSRTITTIFTREEIDIEESGADASKKSRTVTTVEGELYFVQFFNLATGGAPYGSFATRACINNACEKELYKEIGDKPFWMYNAALGYLPFIYPDLQAEVVGTTVTANISNDVDGTYEYSIDNGAFGASNVFNNLTVGLHTIKCREVTQLVEVSIDVEILDL